MVTCKDVGRWLDKADSCPCCRAIISQVSSSTTHVSFRGAPERPTNLEALLVCARAAGKSHIQKHVKALASGPNFWPNWSENKVSQRAAWRGGYVEGGLGI
jgi:hypothetical protein